MSRAAVAAAFVCLLALGSCGRERGNQPLAGSQSRASGATARTSTASAVPPSSPGAGLMVAAVRARFAAHPRGDASAGVLAEGFETVAGGGLSPRYGRSAPKASARVRLPGRATGPLRVEDAATGVAVDVWLEGARDVDAEAADGHLVYARAYASGATVLHRPLADGAEDFIHFETRPAEPRATYIVKLVAGVVGLRLVGGTLEMLDAAGAPRLRVAPPYLVGADGARTDAALAIDGCAVDESPAPPWGRAAVPPGASSCKLVVSWSEVVAYPAVLDPAWTTTGSMASARQGHTATLLSTGRVLVAGGSTGTTVLATAELYDRTSGTWSATGSMTGARHLHSATQLNTSSNPTTSGRVLIAGGSNNTAGTTSVNTAQLYSPTGGTWSAAGNLNVARHGHPATKFADGRVLVGGGLGGTTTLASAAIYNPASGSGSWVATTGPLPPTGQKFHTATLLQTSNMQLNNKVLSVGGNSGTVTLAAVYLFDPPQSAFSTLASMPSPREAHTTTVLANGKLLVAGGRNGSTTVATAAIFDPGFGPGSWSTTGSMTTGRQGHTATLLPDGRVLVAGGSNASGTLSSADLFDGTSSWTAAPAMPAAVRGHTASLLGNGTVLIAGGVNGTTTVASARIYDPTFGTACTSGSQCVTGFCANGVCCESACTGGCGVCNITGAVGLCSLAANGASCADDGNACTRDVCNGTSITCQHPAGNAGAVCRAVAGDCDLAETCTGVSATCPANAFKADGTTCTDDGNACTADRCSGTSAACQHPAGNGGAVCRAASGPCDVTEVCSGAAAICPADAKAPDGTTCSDGNACTLADRCQAGACTGDPKACAPPNACFVAGTCDPATGACADNRRPAGTTPIAGFAYDGAGRQTRDGDAELVYDGYDQLREVRPRPGAGTTPRFNDGKPVVAQRHTYGYDGLRTSTVVAPGTAQARIQYWFSDDYTERADGRRDHYLRVGDRLVARVSTAPVGGGGMAAATGAGKTGAVRVALAGATSGSQNLPVHALLLVVLGLGALVGGTRAQVCRASRRIAGVGIVLASLGGLSCEVLGLSSRDRAVTAWPVVETTFLHRGVSAGPVVVTGIGGAVVEERRFEAFGAPIDARQGAAAPGNIDFTREPQNILGKQTDPDTGWSYHGARWMVPQSARWISPDPATKAPTQALVSAPWDTNPYQYVRQNPTVFWDPGGAAANVWAAIDTTKLRELAAAANIKGRNTNITNQKVGEAFESLAVRLDPVALRNSANINSEVRGGITGGERRAVRPDGIGNAEGVYILRGKTPIPSVVPNGYLLEAKATHGTLFLSSNDYQIEGLIDVAAQTKAGLGPARIPHIVFYTTADTVIAPEIAQKAAAAGITVGQRTLEYCSACPAEVRFRFSAERNLTPTITAIPGREASAGGVLESGNPYATPSIPGELRAGTKADPRDPDPPMVQ
jgi:RHS repeat-associated protein